MWKISFPNSAKCRKYYRKSRPFYNFCIVQDNLKNISGLLDWYLHKEIIFLKSSKTNCGLDFRAPVNILPLYRLLRNSRPRPRTSAAFGYQLGAHSREFLRQTNHSFHVQSWGTLSWGMEKPTKFGVIAAGFWNSSEWSGGGAERCHGRELCKSSGKDKMCWK